MTGKNIFLFLEKNVNCCNASLSTYYCFITLQRNLKIANVKLTMIKLFSTDNPKLNHFFLSKTIKMTFSISK